LKQPEPVIKIKMSYYIFEHFTSPFTGIQIRRSLGAGSFYGKRRLNISPDRLPIEFDLEKPSAGPLPISAGYVDTYCLFSDELLEVLYRVGVDNLDVFPALLFNKFQNVVYKNYKAVSIMGSVAGLDEARSGKADLSDSTGLLKGGVDRMYIESRKADGLLMFRPDPGVGAVLVHERVKKAIETSGLNYFRFYRPSEWGGF
jgi:hypothetical protein